MNTKYISDLSELDEPSDFASDLKSLKDFELDERVADGYQVTSNHASWRGDQGGYTFIYYTRKKWSNVSFDELKEELIRQFQTDG